MKPQLFVNGTLKTRRFVTLKNKHFKALAKHKVALLVTVCVILLVALIFAIVKYNKDITSINEMNQQQLAAMNAQIAASNRSGYVAMTQISQGDVLQDGVNVQISTFSSSADATLFATADCLGKQAVVDIPAGFPITNNVISTSISEQLNERECTFIHLSANLLKGDFVDVRILFPNGESYIVVSKVSIQNPVILSNLVYLWMTEDEIDRLDAAIVDANLHGAIIYTTKYIVPELEPANIVTYQPNAAVISIMQNNPNIVQEAAAALSVSAREGIENRLAAFEEAYPNFELDTVIDEDITQALENINGANSAGTTGTGTPNAGAGATGTPSTGTAGTGTPSTGTAGTAGTGTTGAGANPAGTAGAGTTDTTVTYGN